jgi:hypothetical protein
MQAVKGVMETAIAQRAEMVLLSGDLIQPELAGPAALSLLIQQFERLAQRDIAVYWATGRVDSEGQWLSRISLPDNVHLFSAERVESLSHFRHEHSIATILGRSGATHLRQGSADYHGDPDGPIQLAVAYGETDGEGLIHRNVDYWALGGVHQHKVLVDGPCRIEYAGSPQGRSPQEDGVHGCVLGQVGENRQLQTQLVGTDAVRWRRVTIPAGDATNRDGLLRVMRNRMQEIMAAAGGLPMLVSWTIQADVHTPLHHSGLAEELTGWLREQFGFANPAGWTVSVEVQPPVSYPDTWYEEDSILGDFLRAAHELRTKNTKAIDLTGYASVAAARGELAPAMHIGNPATRGRLLAEAALLGIDLLRGDAALHGSGEHGSRSDKQEASA